jgi:NAD(P)H-nitrite reductase large subunit
MKHIVILGNGISGITLARHLRKRSDHRITVISGETDHFFARTALMYVYMGHLRYEHTKPYEDGFWAKNRIELKKAWVNRIDFDQKVLQLAEQGTLAYDVLVLAVGSQPNRFGWPGQDLEGVQGLYSYQDLERLEALTPTLQRGVVVGGGLIGIEMAEMLLSRHKEVTMLVREGSFWDTVLPAEESALVTRHIRAHGVDLRLSTELQEILPDATGGRVAAVRTSTNDRLDAELVCLAVGVRPNIGFLKGTSLELDQGILVNEYLETNLPDVYALGDCVQHRRPPVGRKAIEQIWYTGRIMGETLARTLCGDRTAYQPGVFFNSAKFFDIEYQTYGSVAVPLDAGTETFYWEHPQGRKALRINFRSDDGAVVGMQSLGLRLRHELCERWIREQQPVGYALANWQEVLFDPEFFPTHQKAIRQAFGEQFPDRQVPSSSTRTSFLRALFS